MILNYSGSMLSRRRLLLTATSSVLNGLAQGPTWKVLGWSSFFVLVAARILVPSRSDGAAGLSVLGSDLLHALGRPLSAQTAALPSAILAALLLSIPISGFILSAGSFKKQLRNRQLRLILLRTSRTEYWLGRFLGDSLLLAGVTLFSCAVALINGAQRSELLSLSHTLHPTLLMALLAWSFGCLFLLSGYLVVIAGRASTWRMLGTALALCLWLLLPAVLGADFLSPLGHIKTAFANEQAAMPRTIITLWVFAGMLTGIGSWLFRRVKL
jgi:hypothetical protein